MGVVYLAEQVEPVRRRVALKIIKLGMDTRAVVARFEAERQALAMMDHPNIAKVLDGGVTETGRPYFVMELVPGVALTEYCDRSRLSTQDRLHLFIEVCHAIQHAHQKGIIHRDIKPSNILVMVDHDVALPKVIDFGIAKAMEGRLTDKTLLTQVEALIGTPAYVSPEQAVLSSRDIDTRSDVYSLGVLLYELMAGSTPFDARELLDSGIEALCETIRETEPTRPSLRLASLSGERLTTVVTHRATSAGRLSHELAGDLDWIVMKCLEKDRNRRYDTANDLAGDIRRYLNHEAVLARPPTVAYRVRKALRRNKLLYGSAALVMASLILGITVSSWQMVAARQARNGAQAAQKIAAAETRKASENEQRTRRLLYATDIYLAQQTLQKNNVGRTRRLLDRHRPGPGEADLRGWEWRYLWQLTRDNALATLTSRPVRGLSVSFSHDGKQLAAGWVDGRIELWDVAERRLHRVLSNHEARSVGRVAFSPRRNYLVATSEPDVVNAYDLDTGLASVLWRAPKTNFWDIKGLSFSADGSKVVIYAGASDAEGDAAWVVNVANSRIEHRQPAVWSNSSLHGAAQLSRDNRRIYVSRSDASGQQASCVCVELATGRELWETHREADYGLTTLALSPDEKVLASATGFDDPIIRLWDTSTGQLLFRLTGHNGWVSKVLFSGDGTRLFSAASDQTVRIWDVRKSAESRVLRGHTDEVYSLAVSDTDQLIASIGKDGKLMLWNEGSSGESDGYRALSLPPVSQPGQALLMDSSHVLLMPQARTPEVIEFKNHAPHRLLPELGAGNGLAAWHGSNLLCHWNGTNHILVREWVDGRFVERAAVKLSSGSAPSGFGYFPARRLLAWCEGSPSNAVFIEELSKVSSRTRLTNDVAGLDTFRFSEDGNFLACLGARRQSLRAWRTDTGERVVSVEGNIRDMAFAVGGTVLVVASEPVNDHEIAFYDLNQPGSAPRRVPGPNYAGALAVSPDGRMVASATGGGLVRLLDPTTGKLIDFVHGHLHGVHGVAFSADGRRLISTSTGGEAVKIWDVGTRQELLTLHGSGSGLDSAKWSENGDAILAGAPWQVWWAPSWQEIEAAEASDTAASRAK